ncbi:MAG TPA: DUF134 domain-containing protein [Ignavibacteriaceae bacterium]|mgnify:CR=1 FL=1|jgi:predicted DNA-binding protein (UPF0251 family)|nr:DUF134 domain-containing protein [Ignavibacteriaceae bacterium]
MPRPEKFRRIRCSPASYYFKPTGVPMGDLDEVPLAHDELEAIRLADLNELFQEDAALKMNISRATFGRIVMRAHKKIADAIINGKAIRISEDIPQQVKGRMFQTCKGCRKKFRQNLQNNKCPKCLSNTKE